MLEVATDLAWAQVHSLGPEGLGQLAGGPGPVLADQVAERRGDVLTPGEIGRRATTPGEEGVASPAAEVVQEIQDGAVGIAEVLGDAGGLPARIGEGDHLQAIADLGREVLSAQALEFVAGRVIEMDVDHTEL